MLVGKGMKSSRLNKIANSFNNRLVKSSNVIIKSTSPSDIPSHQVSDSQYRYTTTADTRSLRSKAVPSKIPSNIPSNIPNNIPNNIPSDIHNANANADKDYCTMIGKGGFGKILECDGDIELLARQLRVQSIEITVKGVSIEGPKHTWEFIPVSLPAGCIIKVPRNKNASGFELTKECIKNQIVVRRCVTYARRWGYDIQTFLERYTPFWMYNDKTSGLTFLSYVQVGYQLYPIYRRATGDLTTIVKSGKMTGLRLFDMALSVIEVLKVLQEDGETMTPQNASVMPQVSQALPIYHFDIKPGNILANVSGKKVSFVLADFGGMSHADPLHASYTIASPFFQMRFTCYQVPRTEHDLYMMQSYLRKYPMNDNPPEAFLKNDLYALADTILWCLKEMPAYNAYLDQEMYDKTLETCRDMMHVEESADSPDPIFNLNWAERRLRQLVEDLKSRLAAKKQPTQNTKRFLGGGAPSTIGSPARSSKTGTVKQGTRKSLWRVSRPSKNGVKRWVRVNV